MLPFINLFDLVQLPTYNLACGTALISAILMFYWLADKQSIRKATVDDMTVVFAAMIPIAATTSILFNNAVHNQWIFTSLGAFISGFTFYGGLIGGSVVAVIGCWIVGREEKNMLKLLDILSVCLMSGHGIGRLGCFLGGCCYGRETGSIFGVLYPIDGKQISVFPVQLYETGFLFILFLFSLRRLPYSLERYMIMYGSYRFLFEFLRGDNRGIISVLSPSQLVSICLIIIGLLVCNFRKRRVLKKSNL